MYKQTKVPAYIEGDGTWRQHLDLCRHLLPLSVLYNKLHRAAHRELVPVARAQLTEVEENHLSGVGAFYEAKGVLQSLYQSLHREIGGHCKCACMGCCAHR